MSIYCTNKPDSVDYGLHMSRKYLKYLKRDYFDHLSCTEFYFDNALKL